MFTHYRTQGFILGKTDRGEFDRVVTIYTKDFGKMDFLAKAERKINSKLRGGLGLFYLSDIEFIQGKAYKILTDVILINNFENLRKDFKISALSFKIAKTLDSLIRGQESDLRIWEFLNEIFEKLSNRPLAISHWQLLYYYFLWNLFSILGYRPELYFCSVCRKKLTFGKIYFSFKTGGLVCSSCQGSLAKEVNPNAVKIIRIIIKGDWPTLKKLKFGAEDLKSLEIFSKHYLLEVLSETE
ncbi:MAG: DNA repair protein RecO [bacterium]|nr:DNA repair protein RecO [bacterium]